MKCFYEDVSVTAKDKNVHSSYTVKFLGNFIPGQAERFALKHVSDISSNMRHIQRRDSREFVIKSKANFQSNAGNFFTVWYGRWCDDEAVPWQ